MKQTAVEWLFEQVANIDWKNLQGEEKIKILEQAKEMEQANDCSLKYLQALELVEHSLQNGSINPDSFIIRNVVRECIGLEPIK